MSNKLKIKILHSFLIFLLSFSCFSQQSKLYEESYQKLSGMIENDKTYNFKDAVFSVENAYLNDKLDTAQLNKQIKSLVTLCNSIIKSRELQYNEKDKEVVSKYSAIFTVMSQPIPVVINDTVYNYKPFQYDFNDVFGHEEVRNLFVSELLETHTGNCNSMPYLYKILAEELGVTAHLALAPNHVYIKHQIQKESIALTLVDLGQAYQKSFPDNDGTFILKCTQKAIEAYPYFANAWILQAETHKKQYEKIMLEKLTTDMNVVADIPEAKALMDKMNDEYSKIYKMGYRSMPESMYLDWLMSLTTEREKYENKNVFL